MEKERLRIACVGYFQGYGGAEKSLICLANALNEKKYRISVINIGNGKIVLNQFPKGGSKAKTGTKILLYT